MDARTSFRLPRLLLPRPGLDLAKWAVVACDQHSAEPEYWDRVAAVVGDAPSTLHLTFPEAYLGAPDAPARIGAIPAAMRRYLAEGLLREHDGTVCVERAVDGHVRRGLMLELDLDAYDFAADSITPIRPTEGTIVERIAPRLAVRRDADLELPHVLVLIDDPARTVIEPLAAERASLAPLYATDLMLGGGRVAGWAVDAVRAERAVRALCALAEPQAFAERHGLPAGAPVLLFAVGDGNHSLATAKAWWESIRHDVGPDHPARWALVEVLNIHDPGLVFAPIHRVLFGVTADIRQALQAEFGQRASFRDVPTCAALRAEVAQPHGERHAAGLIGPGPRYSIVTVASPAAPLAAATFQTFLDRFVDGGGAAELDYVHGDDTLQRLALERGGVGVHLPALPKDELLGLVARIGPLPRKTFSLGEAHEKRYYVEARRIRPAAGAAG